MRVWDIVHGEKTKQNKINKKETCRFMAALWDFKYIQSFTIKWNDGKIRLWAEKFGLFLLRAPGWQQRQKLLMPVC